MNRKHKTAIVTPYYNIPLFFNIVWIKQLRETSIEVK